MLIDDLRVRQILLNLLSSAIKFTERGRVGLELQVEQVTAPICCGSRSPTPDRIPDQVEHLFNRFSQTTPVSRTHGGTGWDWPLQGLTS